MNQENNEDDSELYLLEIFERESESIRKTLQMQDKWDETLLQLAHLSEDSLKGEADDNESLSFLTISLYDWSFLELAECIIVMFEKLYIIDEKLDENHVRALKSDASKLLLFIASKFQHIRDMISSLWDSKFTQYLPKALKENMKSFIYYLFDRLTTTGDECFFLYDVIHEMVLDWKNHLKTEAFKTLSERFKMFKYDKPYSSVIHPLILSIIVIHHHSLCKFSIYYGILQEYSKKAALTRKKSDAILENCKNRPEWNPKEEEDECDLLSNPFMGECDVKEEEYELVDSITGIGNDKNRFITKGNLWQNPCTALKARVNAIRKCLKCNDVIISFTELNGNDDLIHEKLDDFLCNYSDLSCIVSK